VDGWANQGGGLKPFSDIAYNILKQDKLSFTVVKLCQNTKVQIK
jgi:hypothetical protein